MSEEIVIWGASGHGRVVLDAANASGLSVLGFLDDNPILAAGSFAGRPVLGGREQLDALRTRGVDSLHVAIGDCAARLKISSLARAQGFSLHTIMHPRSVVAADASIGAGSFVAANAVVSSGSTVGDSVILNTACSVDHDCVIGDGVHIAPGVRLGGLVHIDRGAFIGIGSTVLNCLRVGEHSTVGGGAVVVRDLPAGVVAYGVPARIMRRNA